MNVDREQLVEFVLNHSTDFYRNHWGKAGSFEELPLMTRRAFAAVPLSRRRYSDGKSLVTIVNGATGPFLAEWNINDIKTQRFGVQSKRPMTYFANEHETLEKAWWCYLNGMIRLTGETNAAVSLATAEKLRIDSLITDPVTLPLMRPLFETMPGPLEAISIVSGAFDAAALAEYAPYAKRIRLVAALPETGTFAEAELSARPAFTLFPHSFVEVDDGNIILTQMRLFATPIIRYDTGIRVADIAISSGSE